MIGWIAADDVNRLVREIDVALNGVDAAPQAKLCDIAAQVGKAAREFGPILHRLGAPPQPASAHLDDWAIAAAFREVTGPNGGLIKNDEVVDFISTRARELIANARPTSAVPLPDPAPQHAQANDWRQKAAEWLEQKALDQEQVNRDYPRHASAYKEWRDRPMILRMLAQDIVTAGDEQAMIKRNCRPPTWMFPDDDFPAPRSLQPGDGWDENVRYLLNRCKHTIRVREGGGAKDLLSSLIVTFTGMEQKIAAADSVDSKAAAEVIEVARDVAKRAGPDREQKLHESLAALDLSASAQQTPPTTQNGES